jgi:hypothetical protein
VKAIDFPIGREHEERGRGVLADFARYYGVNYVLTNPNAPAPVDGILVQRGVVSAVIEVRTRSTYDYAKIKEYGSYLVTAQKLHNLMAAGAMLAAPSVLVIELSCGARLWWRIGDAEGKRCVEWTDRESRTRATSLGPETTVRVNAYLPLSAAVEWGNRDDTRGVA